MACSYIVYITFIILSFGISYYLIPKWIELAFLYKWFDVPNQRKLHKKPTPSVGGLGILSTFLIVCVGIGIFQNSLKQPIWIATVFSSVSLGIVGFYDDRFDMKAIFKLVLIILISLVVSTLGIRIKSLEGILGIWELPVFSQYILSILFLTLCANAYNLIDGINGLAGGLLLIALAILSVVSMRIGSILPGLLLACLAASVAGFLPHNVIRTKTFMGDTGALTLGLLLGIFCMELMGHSVSIRIYDHFEPLALLSIIISLIWIPLADTIFLFIKRISLGYSPFTPDQNHIHHVILRRNENHLSTTLTLLVVQILGFTFTQIGLMLQTEVMFVIFTQLMGIIVFMILSRDESLYTKRIYVDTIIKQTDFKPEHPNYSRSNNEVKFDLEGKG